MATEILDHLNNTWLFYALFYALPQPVGVTFNLAKTIFFKCWRFSAIFHAIISLFLQHLFYVITIQCDYDIFHRIERFWRSLETYFMIETAEFFSFHFIALSRPPPSWCSQSVRPLVVFDRSARLCKNSPEGALCVQ
jgi:hypothetical protein